MSRWSANRLSLLSLLSLLLAGCTAVPASPHEKPRAPVEVTALSSDLGGGVHQVLVEAVGAGPLRATLVLPDGAELVGGATSAEGPGPRVTVVATVRARPGTILGAGGERSGQRGAAVTSVRVGSPAPPARAARVVVTPFGPVAEAGP